MKADGHNNHKWVSVYHYSLKIFLFCSSVQNWYLCARKCPYILYALRPSLKEVSPTLTALQVLCFTCSHVYLPCGWLCQRLVLFVLYLPLNFLFAASTQSLLANTQNVLSALASVILGIFEGAGVLILLGPGPVRIAFLGAHCHCFQKEKHSQWLNKFKRDFNSFISAERDVIVKYRLGLWMQ